MFQSGKASLQTNPKRQRERTLNSSRFAGSPSLALRVRFVGHSLSIEKFASRVDRRWLGWRHAVCQLGCQTSSRH
jgi:hypothetical protein